MLASSNKTANIVAWVMQVAVAGAFIVMGALPKLTSDPMAVELFDRIGGPSFAIYLVGAIELIAAILIIIPKTRVYGAILAAISMVGAIGAHAFTPLGWMPEFPVEGTDEMQAQPMVIMAFVFLALAASVAFLRRDEIGSSTNTEAKAEPAQQD